MERVPYDPDPLRSGQQGSRNLDALAVNGRLIIIGWQGAP